MARWILSFGIGIFAFPAWATLQAPPEGQKKVAITASLGGIQCDSANKCNRFYNNFSEVEIVIKPTAERGSQSWVGEAVRSFDVDGVTFTFTISYVESVMFEQHQVRVEGKVENSLRKDDSHRSAIFISTLAKMPVFMINGETVSTQNGTVTPILVFSPSVNQLRSR